MKKQVDVVPPIINWQTDPWKALFDLSPINDIREALDEAEKLMDKQCFGMVDNKRTRLIKAILAGVQVQVAELVRSLPGYKAAEPTKEGALLKAVQVHLAMVKTR